MAGRRHWDRTFLQYFLALGAGFMLAVAFLRMVPESLEKGSHAYLYVLIGYFVVHLTEHTLTPHFHFGEEIHHDALVHPAVGYLGLAGLCIHTFFDGVAIASGFLVSRPLGFILFGAVLLHKLPEGFAVGSLMLASGASRRAALLASAVLGLATVAGVVFLNAVHRDRRTGAGALGRASRSTSRPRTSFPRSTRSGAGGSPWPSSGASSSTTSPSRRWRPQASTATDGDPGAPPCACGSTRSRSRRWS